MDMEECLEIEHLHAEGESKTFNEVEILLRSVESDVSVLNFLKQTIIHMICCIRLEDYSSDDKCSSVDEYEEYYRDKRLLELILEQSFDVNGIDIVGKTALLLTCENQNVYEVMGNLLNVSKKKGTRLDFDAVDSAGETALSGAFKRGDRCIAEVIFKARLSAAKEEDKEKDVVKSLLAQLLCDYDAHSLNLINMSSCPRFHKDTKMSYSPLFVNNFDFWSELVIGADSKSEFILNLLLNYGDNVNGQDCGTSHPLLHRLIYQEFGSESMDLCIGAIEILLKSGRINVNASSFSSNTPLHSVLDNYSKFGRFNNLDCKEDDIAITKVAMLLLLHHGANINTKDHQGTTALAMTTNIHVKCVSLIKTILDWAKEKKIRLDLNVLDLKGRTALIKAAKWKNPIAVEMLLEAGASVNVSDNRGFTALHYALFEIPNPFLWVLFGNLTKGYIEVGKRNDIIDALFDSNKPHKSYHRNRNELNTDKIKTINLLLKCSELDVNALDCEGYSPLDIAELSITEVPSSTIDSLKQRGAKLSVFQSKYLQPFNNLDFLRREVKNNVLFYFRQAETNEVLTKLSQATMEHLVSPRDEKLRTALHHATIWLETGYDSDRKLDCIFKTLISLGCNVNDADIYGRTPLHYAVTENIKSILLKYGADNTIKDNNGISAADITKVLEEIESKSDEEESSMYVFFKPFLDCIKQEFQLSLSPGDESRPCRHQVNPLTIAETVWKTGEYASRHSRINEVTRDVINFIENLASEIKKLDPLFEVKTVFVGSSYEGTKIDKPDEFDFDFVLTKFGQICTVCQSPELPTGFCHLKRKSGTKEDGYESFFDEEGILITERVNTRFKILLNNALTDDRFILHHLNFDWSKCPIENVQSMFHVDVSLAATITLTKTNLDLNVESSLYEISIDIVPCIHIDGWWPDEAISNVSEEIKAIGCNLVFDQPQRLFPWVPFSRSCVRISFAPAESEMIKQSCEEAKKAYMIGKQMLEYARYDMDARIWNTSYVLKNSLLYCIEAFVLASEIDFHLWLESLMKCHFEFVFQDFCPCYFMPNFIIPIEPDRSSFYPKYLSNDDKWSFIEQFISYAHYRMCLLHDSHHRDPPIESNFCFKMPFINPIIEHFDRRSLISDLSKLARNYREAS